MMIKKNNIKYQLDRCGKCIMSIRGKVFAQDNYVIY